MQASTVPFGTQIAGNECVVEHAVNIALPLYRTNHCTDPSFEQGLGQWFAIGTGSVHPTISISTAHPALGTRSMYVALGTGAADSSFVLVPMDSTYLPGALYQITMDIYLDTACPPIELANTAFSTIISTRGTHQTLTAYVTPGLGDTGPLLVNDAATVAGAGVGFWVDTVLVEAVATPGTYFDGDTAGGQWLGVPGLSASRVNVDPYPDVTVSVESLNVQRQLTTDMPDDTRLITGYPSGQATIVLSGIVGTDESMTAAWLFGPDQATSPLYRTSPLLSLVTIDLGLCTAPQTVELIRTFTGYIDDVEIDAVSGQVTITALDPSTLLRPSVTFPAIAGNNTIAGQAFVQTGISSTWLMEYALRLSGFYASPPPRPSCCLYVSNHGSAWPEIQGDPNAAGVGYTVATSTFAIPAGLPSTPPTYLDIVTLPGVYGDVLLNPTLLDIPLAGWDTLTAHANTNGSHKAIPQLGQASFGNNPWYAEGWVFADINQDGSSGGSQWMVSTASGNYQRITLLWTLGGGSVSFVYDMQRGGVNAGFTALTGSMTTEAWHHVSTFVTYLTSTTATVTVTVDNVSHTTTVTGLPSTPSSDEDCIYGRVILLGGVEAFQFTTEGAPTPYNSAGYTFTPTVVLDHALSGVNVVPDTAGLTTKQAIQQLCEAEGGIGGFDEHGIFRFVNRNNFLAAASSRTIASTESLESVTSSVQAATVATHVTQAVAGYAQSSTLQYVWQASDIISVPALGTYEAIVSIASGGIALSPQALDSGYQSGTPPTPVTGWRAAKTPAGGGPITSGITVTTTNVTATTLLLKIVNSNYSTVYMVSPVGLSDVPVGSPYVYIAGNTATAAADLVADSQWPPVSEGGAITNARYGEILLALPSNPYMQDITFGQARTDATLEDLYAPRPLLTNLSMLADPRIQLADRCTLVDADGLAINDDIMVIGTSITDSVSAWNQTLDARRINTPGGWLMGVAGRSEMGVATYV